MSKYGVMQDGRVYRFDRGDILRFACCHCGLVHDFKFAETRRYKYFSATLRVRSTGQLRRHRSGDLHRGVGGWALRKGVKKW